MGLSGNLSLVIKDAKCNHDEDGRGEEDDGELQSGLEPGNLPLPVTLAFQKHQTL